MERIPDKDFDIFVKLLDIPCNEAVTENSDGSFTIFVNQTLDRSGRIRAVAHALKHIRRNDFASDLTASEIEAETH